MLKTAFVALYLISLPGASAWAHPVVRVDAVAVVPLSSSAIVDAVPEAQSSSRADYFFSVPVIAAPSAPVVPAAPEAGVDHEETAATDARTAPVAARSGDDGHRRERRTNSLHIAGAVAIILASATAYGILIHGWDGALQQWESGIQETLHEDVSSF